MTANAVAPPPATRAYVTFLGGAAHPVLCFVCFALFHWATSLGFFATAIAVGAALNLFPAANGFGGLGATLLLSTLAVAVAGVNLLTAGVCLTGTAAADRTLLPFPSRAAAFARRNISVLAVSGASGAATGIILGGAAHPVLCFVCFALFLLSVSLAVAGVASGSG